MTLTSSIATKISHHSPEAIDALTEHPVQGVGTQHRDSENSRE
jgi:hypothetical protein